MSRAQVSVVVAWAVVGLVFVGWGTAVRRLWREPVRNSDDLWGCFWLGWATHLGFLQVWHLFRPIDTKARLLVAVVGALGLVAAGAQPWRRIAARALSNLPVLIAWAGLVWWLSNRALEGARFGDTGAYYIPTIRWALEYPVVIGLGNLYAYYAFNQTYFLYGALLDAWTFAGRPFHVLNSLLLLALAARGLLGVWRLLRPGAHATRRDLFHAMMLPGEAAVATGLLLTSPSPDFAVFTYGIAVMDTLIALAGARGRRARGYLCTLAVLTAVGPTIKLSFAGLAIAALLVGMWWCWRRSALGMRDLVTVTAIGVLVVGPWMVGNVLMTGCPLFPTSIAALAVEWRVASDVVHGLQAPITTGPWTTFLRDPTWFLNRLANLGWSEWDALVPLQVAALAAAVTVLRGGWRLIRRRPRATDRPPLLLIVPPLASLAFTMTNMPMPRYAGSAAALLGVTVLMVAAEDLLLRRVGRVLIVTASVVLVAWPLHSSGRFYLGLTDFQRPPAARVQPVRLASGLEVYVPSQTNLTCWDAFPCTPVLNPGLRLRRAGDLGSGFVLDPAPSSS